MVSMAPSALALSAYATKKAVAANTAEIVAFAIFVLVILFDGMRASMIVAASVRVTSRFVTAAEVRPARAHRTSDG